MVDRRLADEFERVRIWMVALDNGLEIADLIPHGASLIVQVHEHETAKRFDAD